MQVSHRTPLGNYTIFTIPATYRDAVSHVGDEPFGLLIYERSTSLTINSISGHPAGMQFKTGKMTFFYFNTIDNLSSVRKDGC